MAKNQERKIEMMDAEKKSDSIKLTTEEEQFLKQFKERRALFDEYLKSKRIGLHTCPGCGYPTLGERGNYDICAVCTWADDGQDDDTERESWGGPNSISLTENRINIGRQLNERARNVSGQINSNPQEVLIILQNHEARMDKISNSIPLDADTSHQGWKDWKNAEQELLTELIKR